MAFFAYFAVYSALAVVSAIYRTKMSGKRPPKQNFDSSALPTVSESTPLPVLFGTMRITPNLVWYWLKNGGAADYAQTHTDINGNEYQVVRGYKYGGDFHFIICAAPSGDQHLPDDSGSYSNVVEAFYIGEKKFYEPSTDSLGTGGTGYFLQDKSFFGGLYKGGGVDGNFTWQDGTQTTFPFMYQEWEVWKNLISLGISLGQTPYQSVTPAYKNVLGVALDDFYFGESPVLPPVSFTTRCIPDFTGAIESRVSNTLGPDANPVAIIYALLTNQYIGLGLSTDAIDVTSFNEVAETLNTEGFGLTVYIPAETSPNDIIANICDHIDAAIWEDHATGTIMLKLIREDYTVGALFELDEDNVVSVEGYSSGTWEDTYNLVRLAYSSRDMDYKETYLGLHDGANFAAQSEKLRVLDVKYPYCMTPTVARKILDRELRGASIPRRAIRLKANREAFNLTPGSVFRLSWDAYDIEDMVFRVLNIDLGALDRNTVTIEAMQDLFDAVQHTHSNEEDDDTYQTALDLPAKVVATPIGGRDVGVIELPFFFLSQLEDSNLFIDPNRISKLMFCFTPTIAEDKVTGSEYEILMSVNDGDVNLHQTNLTFHEYAQVAVDYPFDTESYDEIVGLTIKGVSNLAMLKAATEADIRAYGQNMIMVNGEFLAFEDFTDNLDGTYTLSPVWRELLDTGPRDLLEDDVVVFLTPRTPKNISPSVFSGDEEVSLVARSYNGVQLSEEAVYSDFDLDKRPLLPAPPQNLLARFDNLDPNTQPSPSRETREVNTDPFIKMDFAERSRLVEAVVRGDDADDTPEDGTKYEIQGKHFYDLDWTTLVTSIDGPTDAESWINENLPFGDTEVRVQSYRDIDITGTTDIRYSFDGPIVRFDHASFRQLLKSTVGNNHSVGWTTASGTWSFNTSSTPLWGGVGTVIKQTTTGSAEYETAQTVNIPDLFAPGKTAKLSFYVMADSATAHEYKVTVAALDSGGSTLSSATSNSDAWTTPSVDTWDKVTVSLADLPYGTEKLKVRLRAKHGNGFAAHICFTRLDLRLGTLSSDQATNGSFTSAVTSWTQASGVWTASASSNGLVPFDGTTNKFALGPATAASAELYQEVNVPAGYAEGYCLVKWLQGMNATGTDTGFKVILEARDSGGVLETLDPGYYDRPDAQDTWQKKESALRLPEGTIKVRIRLICLNLTNVGGTRNGAFDEVECYFEKKTALHVRSEAQMKGRLAAEPGLLWLFNQDSGDTTADDLVASETLTADGSPEFGSSSSGANSRAVWFNETTDALVADDTTVFETADGSFAVYLEFDYDSTNAGAMISKCDADGLGWRIIHDDTTVFFYVNNGDVVGTIECPDILESPDVNQMVFVCRKVATPNEADADAGYLDLAAYYVNSVNGEVTKVAGDVVAADKTAFGDFTNTGVLTMGANAYTGYETGDEWEAEASTGHKWLQVGLFSGPEVDRLALKGLERLRLSKGY